MRSLSTTPLFQLQDNIPVVVRVIFVLGSLTSSEEEHRLKILEHEGSIELLLSMLVTHVDALLLVAADATATDSTEASARAKQALINHPSQDVLGLSFLFHDVAVSDSFVVESSRCVRGSAILRTKESDIAYTLDKMSVVYVSCIFDVVHAPSCMSMCMHMLMIYPGRAAVRRVSSFAKLLRTEAIAHHSVNSVHIFEPCVVR